MQKHRIISLASVLAMVLIPVIGWFLVAQPQFDAAALADTQRADVDTQAASTAAVVAELRKQSDRLPELSDELDELRGSIPAVVESSQYIDGLTALAAASGVSIGALTVDAAQAYVPAIAPVDPNAVVPEESADGAEAPVAPPVIEADPAIVTNPLITTDNFVAIPVTVDVSGSYDGILNFIEGLRTGSRLFLVSRISTEADPLTGSQTSQIGGFIYAIPTGLPGDPSPVSTQVKIMDAPVAVPVETDDEENADGSTPSPTPTPTPTPAP